MHILAEMPDARRRMLGVAFLILGSLGVAFGIFWAHFAFLADPSPVTWTNWIPRHWTSVAFGQLNAVVGSQMVVLGALMLWVISKPLTWARAGFLTFVTWFQLVLFFGIIPSEWLTLAQGPLQWTRQNIFLTVPANFLPNGSEIEVTGTVLKDAVSGGYHTVMLGAAIVFAYKIQDFGKKPKASSDDVVSPYGRSLTKVSD